MIVLLQGRERNDSTSRGVGISFSAARTSVQRVLAAASIPMLNLARPHESPPGRLKGQAHTNEEA